MAFIYYYQYSVILKYFGNPKQKVYVLKLFIFLKLIWLLKVLYTLPPFLYYHPFPVYFYYIITLSTFFAFGRKEVVYILVTRMVIFFCFKI